MQKDVQALLDEVKSHYDHPLEVAINGEASGVLTHDQSHQRLKKDGTLEVVVTDTTDVAYTLSHELLHLLFQMKGYPQLQFHLLSGDPQVDDQLYATSTALYNAAVHMLVVAWQREHGLLTDKVVAQVLAGFKQNVPAEADDQLVIYRILSLLDLLGFLEGQLPDELASAYPQALPYAQELFSLLDDQKLASPFGLRRAIVHLFERFDAQIEKLGYQPTNDHEFATVSPVLSKRQLRLTLDQVYLIKHSSYRDRDTKQPAYVAMGRSDDQNAFVLPLPEKETTPEAFQQLYQQPLDSVLTKYGLDFTIR
ncbi:hypothetical protein [Lacticaseibacillus zeae]|uniref:IpaB/EvcA family protein n=1 Tax=Lacticaseibacillus zeae subsp. silagei TaxID=3068307 RepID=A0ABD7Z8A7_LACZE|nr:MULTISPECIES: hypothetical protein [Lacticaseibacillus]MDE3316478.1 hypothetical protein [Lacticaseibacillus zeae]OFR96850.1 hypothetical protein HMPREF2861_08085 [Lactobacillus sp. HMSC068F07]WLV83277.1 hypothetical protein LACZS2_002507 [Lacticaseibacillus sp. NCIMB 15475]WLV86026.1 hypothetical protein LACZS1_002455 [Lacticaseibacillus sp. NCIMB 15474]